MIILGIETSCDDTGVAIVKVSGKKGPLFNILSNVVSSQIKTHAPFGGVVPNLAAREHLKNIEPCLKQAFQETSIPITKIDLIAVTVGPGLIPCLLVGVNFARALAYKWQKPIVGVNHIEGHIIAALAATRYKIQDTRYKQIPNLNNQNFKHLFPAVALVVSGGHTQLVLVKEIGEYKIIGETRDDAAGECFDKVAKLLGLGYPGGPIIAAQAAQIRNPKSKIQNKSKIPNTKYQIHLPRPMMGQKNFDFSFSGLKTAVLYLLKDIKQKFPFFCDREKKGIDIIPELCYETQQAIIDVLIDKTLRAAQEYKAKTVILSGGVAANEELRKQFKLKIENLKLKIEFLTPSKILCTDNAAMIAAAGYFNKPTTWRKIKADANLRIS